MDCERLSLKAQKIFKQIILYYPPDPWNNLRWTDEGKVWSNGWHDLRKGKDRNYLIEHQKQFIGYQIQIEASSYKQKHKCVPRGELGWMVDFTRHHFPQSTQYSVELLLLLLDLDFQIETLDAVVEPAD